jgi:hypothetical protein
MSGLDRIREILAHDFDPEFLRDIAVSIAWEYYSLHDSIYKDGMIPAELKPEYFAKTRSDCAIRSLVTSARKHGVPFDFRRLECNGQQKLILKVGRIILIQETFSDLTDGPQTAQYKKQLADTHCLIRQLELDLGDQSKRILDWSGSVVAVLLHGADLLRLRFGEKPFGGLMLGVPNEKYDSWV